MRRFLHLVVATLLFAVPVNAFGWNNIGHMTVAYVAWQRLDAGPKAQVAALVKLNPLYSTWDGLIPANITGTERDMYLFMIAATWPDQIKEMGSQFTCNGQQNNDTAPAGEDASLNTGYVNDQCMHKYWHFVDVSLGTPAHATPAINGNVKIEAFRTALATNEDDALKSYDLVWLEHLVGDMHQPLHCVTRYSAMHPKGDGGANSVKTTSPTGELHGYWDGLLGNATHNLFTDAKLAETVAGKLPALSDADAGLAKDNDSDDWVTESFNYAKSTAYVAPVGAEWGPYALNPTYHHNAVLLAQKRVSFAGIRLAALLNTAFAGA